MNFKPFEQKVWLSSPTMHGDELKYITEAYETNWMSTVGKNIDEVEEKLRMLKEACEADDDHGVRETMRIAVPTFRKPEEVNRESDLKVG